MHFALPTSGHDLPCAVPNFTGIAAVTAQPAYSIPDLGEVPMEAAIFTHVHPLVPSFRPGGGQALPLPTVSLLTLFSLLLMIALEINHQLNYISLFIYVSIMYFLCFLRK